MISPQAVVGARFAKFLIGSGKVLAGQAGVSIPTTPADTNSKVIVTFTSDYAPASRYVVMNKIVGEGFTVSLDTPVVSDADFDWVVIGAGEVSQNPLRINESGNRDPR